MTRQVLFLCTGNSCRSHLAEAAYACQCTAECCVACRKRGHLGFPDPAKATGPEDEIMAVFRSVRDDMLLKIPDLLRRYSAP